MQYRSTIMLKTFLIIVSASIVLFQNFERTIQKECTHTATWDKSFNTRPLYYCRRVYCFIIMLVLFSDLCIRFVRYKGNKKSCSFQPLKIISFENQNSILRWLTDEQLIFLFKKIKEKTWLYFSCSDFL